MPYFVLHAIVRPQALALSDELAPDNFDTMTDSPSLITGAERARSRTLTGKL